MTPKLIESFFDLSCNDAEESEIGEIVIIEY